MNGIALSLVIIKHSKDRNSAYSEKMVLIIIRLDDKANNIKSISLVLARKSMIVSHYWRINVKEKLRNSQVSSPRSAFPRMHRGRDKLTDR